MFEKTAQIRLHPYAFYAIITRQTAHAANARPHGQAVKTSPSHGGIWGSIPHEGTKKGSRSCFFLYLDRGTKKGSKSCFFSLPRQGYQKRQQKLLFLFTSIAKSAQAMSAYANAAGGICTKKRRGGIETPRRCAPKTRNSHDAVWCHFINLHVQGGSTAAACFCLPLDEGA